MTGGGTKGPDMTLFVYNVFSDEKNIKIFFSKIFSFFSTVDQFLDFKNC